MISSNMFTKNMYVLPPKVSMNATMLTDLNPLYTSE